MSLSVSFRHSARAELIEAAACYESERQNLGVEFIAKIERCVAAAAERPMTYTAVYKDVRRVVAKRFPFSVYFRAKPTVSSFWPFSMAAGTQRFGSAGLSERRR